VYVVRRLGWRLRPGERRTGVRVLVIEDDGELADAIGAGLRQERMAVDVAYDGRRASSARWSPTTT